MESVRIKVLLDKFYAGETTLEEERALKAYFVEGSRAEPEEEDKLLFRYLEYARRERPAYELDWTNFKGRRGRAPVRWLTTGIWATGIAASVLLLAGIFLPARFKKQQNSGVTISSVTKEQETASAEIRQALLIISVNLNKGEQNVAKISKFSKAQNIVTSKKSK